jgi:hypothetical protein
MSRVSGSEKQEITSMNVGPIKWMVSNNLFVFSHLRSSFPSFFKLSIKPCIALYFQMC